AGGGLAITIAGAVELPRGQELVGELEEPQRYIDHRRTGQVLLGVGVVVLAAGIVMAATDMSLRAKKRKGAREPRTTLMPVIQRDFAGAAFGGRF
ncbi:MAG: hypothetical protein HC927_05990, partial [Deltaproteobacteria bacterium]|nr:hypothetical protein [Deltaproteobacteria bacterium]